ncbi:unnamed protein product [Caenorhabditis nigoni]
MPVNVIDTAVWLKSVDQRGEFKKLSLQNLAVIYLQKETQTEKDVMLEGFLFGSRRNDGSTKNHVNVIDTKAKCLKLRNLPLPPHRPPYCHRSRHEEVVSREHDKKTTSSKICKV